MKVARLLVLTVAIGAGLAAAMVATSMIGTNEAPPSTPVARA